MEELYNLIKKEYKHPKINFKPFYPNKPTFFEFLFQHFFKIRKWNKGFDLLRISLFVKKKISLKPLFRKKLEEIYENYFLPIKPFLEEILREGWRWDFLSIREYNLMVLFMDMLIKLENITKSFNDIHFFSFEESFMRMYKNSTYFSLFFEALKKSYDNIEKIKIKKLNKILKIKDSDDNKEEDEFKIAIEKVYYIFNQGYMYPSLFDIIFAFNIYQTYRFLDKEILFKQDVIPTIQSGFYECTKEIFEEILKEFSNLLKEKERLNKEKERIEWLKTICESDNNNKIFSFYNKTFKSWDNDKEDFFYIFLNFTKVLVEKLDLLLFKEWEAIDKDDRPHNIKILDSTEFEPLYQRIYNDFLHLKAKYFISNSSNRISLEQYLKIDNLVTVLDENQKILYEKMLNILLNLKIIADRLHNLVENLINKKESPFERLLISYPVEFKGNSIIEVINSYVEADFTNMFLF